LAEGSQLRSEGSWVEFSIEAFVGSKNSRRFDQELLVPGDQWSVAKILAPGTLRDEAIAGRPLTTNDQVLSVEPRTAVGGGDVRPSEEAEGP